MGDCFERTPYVSLISFALVLTGSGIMCGTNYEAFRRTIYIFDESFYPIKSLHTFQLAGLVFAVVTVFVGILNAIFGALTTGDTREKVYTHKKSQSSGRLYSYCLSASTYLLTWAWILVFIVFAVPVALWTMLHTVCREETEYWRSISADKDETAFSYTFNLTNYGLYYRPLDTSLYSEYINSPSAFTELCQEIATVGPLFSISLLASMLVIIGLHCFIACLASTSVRLELSTDLDRVRRFAETSLEVALPLIPNPQPIPSLSRMEIQPNVFSYTNPVTAGVVYPRRSSMSTLPSAFTHESEQQQTPSVRAAMRS